MTKNNSLSAFVAIEPYQSGYDMTFTELHLTTSYWKGRGVQLHVQPCHRTERGDLEEMMMCFNTLEDGMYAKERIPMSRFNAKQLENIHKDFVGMGEKIAKLWNERNFDGIKELFS
jgi:hypothetical protein